VITRVVGGAVLCVALLGACGSDDEVDADVGAASEPAGVVASATPTGPSLQEQQVTWAGEVCRSRSSLNDAVSSLGSNLDIEFGSDQSILDQLDRQLRWQVLVIASSASDLLSLMAGAPVEPKQANDWVMEISGATDTAQAAVDDVTAELDALGKADGFLDGVQAAGSAVLAGTQAYQAGAALVEVVQTVTEEAQIELGPAFAQAPDCSEFTSTR